jgi:hypothetical protein
VKWTHLKEVVAMCYTYREYRKEEEARKKRQQELRGQRREEVRQAQKRFADRERVLVKS